MGFLRTEFVNWDNNPARPVGGGMFDRRSKQATDLHIIFKQGGVTPQNPPPKGVHKITQNAGGNTFDIDLQPPLESNAYTAPAGVGPNGALNPPQPPAPRTSIQLDFTRNGQAPKIDKWWWTYKGVQNSKPFTGDPSEDPEERKKRKE